jgi:hypothetical protein
MVFYTFKAEGKICFSRGEKFWMTHSVKKTHAAIIEKGLQELIHASHLITVSKTTGPVKKPC